MSSAWDVFGDEDAPAAPPACAPDALACEHPFFADSQAAHAATARGGDAHLHAVLEAVTCDAPEIARRCGEALTLSGETQAAALLQSAEAADAERFCAAALVALARGAWAASPAWEEAHALRRVQLAAAALRGGDPLSALRHVDEAALAGCRSRAEAYAGGPPALRAALAAVTHAAAAAAPPPPPPPPSLPPWALRVPAALPPGVPLHRPGATPASAVPCVDYATLSVPAFVNAFLAPGRPVLLRGLADDWPATSRWADLGTLRNARTLPVELPGGVVAHMTLAALIDDHLAPAVARVWGGDGGSASAPPATAYVSQHGALEQVASLAAAVRVPRLACGALRAANLWLGTDGTVTALHTDDMQNVLVQVFGFKTVRLYCPPPGPGGDAALAAALRAAPHPRAAPGAPLNLFCQADAEAEAAALRAAYPGLDAMPPPLEALLGPGDALFIPRGAWHYVRALTPSCSVNWWW